MGGASLLLTGFCTGSAGPVNRCTKLLSAHDPETGAPRSAFGPFERGRKRLIDGRGIRHGDRFLATFDVNEVTRKQGKQRQMWLVNAHCSGAHALDHRHHPGHRSPADGARLGCRAGALRVWRDGSTLTPLARASQALERPGHSLRQRCSESAAVNLASILIRLSKHENGCATKSLGSITWMRSGLIPSRRATSQGLVERRFFSRKVALRSGGTSTAITFRRKTIESRRSAFLDRIDEPLRMHV